jgi:hypothetical protein
MRAPKAGLAELAKGRAIKPRKMLYFTCGGSKAALDAGGHYADKLPDRRGIRHAGREFPRLNRRKGLSQVKVAHFFVKKEPRA